MLTVTFDAGQASTANIGVNATFSNDYVGSASHSTDLVPGLVHETPYTSKTEYFYYDGPDVNGDLGGVDGPGIQILVNVTSGRDIVVNASFSNVQAGQITAINTTGASGAPGIYKATYLVGTLGNNGPRTLGGNPDYKVATGGSTVTITADGLSNSTVTSQDNTND